MNEENNNRMKKRTENKTTRIDPSFREEMDDVREERKNEGKEGLSDRKITSLIPKHKSWRKIKEDLIEYDENDD